MFMLCTSFSYVLLRLNHCHVSKYAAPYYERKMTTAYGMRCVKE